MQRHEDAPNHDDAELLREFALLRARGGDPRREGEIISTLVGGWEPIFKGWLSSRFRREDADEIGARVVVRLVELLVSGRKMTASWRACVWRIVRDERFAFMQRRKRSNEDLVSDVYTDPDAHPAEESLEEVPLDPELDAARLTEVVKRLSERDQQVIELLIIEERPRREVARLLGLTVNALDQARHRAVKHLAKLAAEHGVSGDSHRDEREA